MMFYPPWNSLVPITQLMIKLYNIDIVVQGRQIGPVISVRKRPASRLARVVIYGLDRYVMMTALTTLRNSGSPSVEYRALLTRPTLIVTGTSIRYPAENRVPTFL